MCDFRIINLLLNFNLLTMKNNKMLGGTINKVPVKMVFLLAIFLVVAVTGVAQSRTVSGTVIDKTGEAVIGASVVVRGTTNGTITDFDGNFTLQNVPVNGTIQVSFVGYKTVDIPIQNQSIIKVTLEEDTEKGALRQGLRCQQHWSCRIPRLL